MMKAVNPKNVAAEGSHQASRRVVSPNRRWAGRGDEVATAPELYQNTTPTWAGLSGLDDYRLFRRLTRRRWVRQIATIDQLIGDVVEPRVVGSGQQRFERRTRVE